MKSHTMGKSTGCLGVWATGKTLEECRRQLAEVIDGWIIVRLSNGLPIPPIGEISIKEPERIDIGG